MTRDLIIALISVQCIYSTVTHRDLFKHIDKKLCVCVCYFREVNIWTLHGRLERAVIKAGDHTSRQWAETLNSARDNSVSFSLPMTPSTNYSYFKEFQKNTWTWTSTSFIHTLMSYKNRQEKRSAWKRSDWLCVTSSHTVTSISY